MYDGRRFEKWREEAEAREPRLLYMGLSDVMVEDDASEVQKYPDEMAVFGEHLRIDYRFDPGAADDGVTVVVPVAVLGQLDAVSAGEGGARAGGREDEGDGAGCAQERAEVQ